MKGDWVYIKSEVLKQEIAYDKNSGWLFCKDGVRYSPAELTKLKKHKDADFPFAVHLLKKYFDGELIQAGN